MPQCLSPKPCPLCLFHSHFYYPSLDSNCNYSDNIDCISTVLILSLFHVIHYVVYNPQCWSTVPQTLIFFHSFLQAKICKPSLNTFLIGCLPRLFSYHPFFLLPTQSFCSSQVYAYDMHYLCLCPWTVFVHVCFLCIWRPYWLFSISLTDLWKICSNLFSPQVHGIYVLFDYKCIDLRYFVWFYNFR